MRRFRIPLVQHPARRKTYTALAIPCQKRSSVCLPMLSVRHISSHRSLSESQCPLHHHSIIDLHPLQPQLALRNVDLAHQLRVGLGHVVEGQHAVAELEEQEGAEGNEGPEGELFG